MSHIECAIQHAQYENDTRGHEQPEHPWALVTENRRQLVRESASEDRVNHRASETDNASDPDSGNREYKPNHPDPFRPHGPTLAPRSDRCKWWGAVWRLFGRLPISRTGAMRAGQIVRMAINGSNMDGVRSSIQFVGDE